MNKTADNAKKGDEQATPSVDSADAQVKPQADRPKPEPKPLTPEYHKARKQLMLWASILLVWELVGVDLSKAEAMGGTLGAVIAAVKSPQAIPWVLVTLVAYFLFKVFVEWHQCSESRKTIRFAKFDYYSGWMVAFAAFALYFGQTISRIQFADWLGRDRNALAFSFGLSSTLMLSIFSWVSWWERDGRLPTRLFNYGLLVLFFVSLVVFLFLQTTKFPVVIGIVVGLAIDSVILLLVFFGPTVVASVRGQSSI